MYLSKIVVTGDFGPVLEAAAKYLQHLKLLDISDFDVQGDDCLPVAETFRQLRRVRQLSANECRSRGRSSLEVLVEGLEYSFVAMNIMPNQEWKFRRIAVVVRTTRFYIRRATI